MNKELTLAWIRTVLNYQPGESVFLPVENRQMSTVLANEFHDALKRMAVVDPVGASKIHITRPVKDGRYWVELRRVETSPLVGFKKGIDGKTSRVVLEDPERTRRLTLMCRDGLTLEEVEAIEGELTDEERMLFNAPDNDSESGV